MQFRLAGAPKRMEAEEILDMSNEASFFEQKGQSHAYGYSLSKRLLWALAGIVLGVIIAGFWNYKLVDNFGNHFLAGHTIGDTKLLAGSFERNGFGFGFLFAAVAGLAATFTACNCVVFAMLPGLACSDRSLSKRSALRALGLFSLGVLAVSLVYGFYVGSLGPEGIKHFTSSTVRLHRAQVTFTAIGIVMVLWGAFAFGFLNRLTDRLPVEVRRFFDHAATKAGIMGIMVGLFAIGRPFPVFRDFLEYAAASDNPLYGSLVMGLQGLGQIAFMVVLFLVMVFVFGQRLQSWTLAKPHQPALVSSLALFIGGSYFIFYWGLAFAYDIGRWGFKFGWYH
jgi:hypothetical protein